MVLIDPAKTAFPPATIDGQASNIMNTADHAITGIAATVRFVVHSSAVFVMMRFTRYASRTVHGSGIDISPTEILVPR